MDGKKYFTTSLPLPIQRPQPGPPRCQSLSFLGHVVVTVVMPILNAAEAMRLNLGSNISTDSPAGEQGFAGPAEIPHGEGRNGCLVMDPVMDKMADTIFDYGYTAGGGKKPFTPQDLGFMDSSIEYELGFR